MKRKLYFLLVLSLAIVLTLTGCGGANNTTEQQTEAVNTEAEETGEKVLVVGIPGDIENLDPTFASFPRSTEAIANLYDQLTTYEIKQLDSGLKIGDTEKVIGSIVEDIELAEDGVTYTFHLRKDIKFNSGNPLTAEDVRWSFDRAANAGQGSGTFDLSVATISKPVEVIDDYTFRIVTDKQNPITLQVLSMGGLSIFDSKEMQKHATADDPWAVEWTKKNAAGSGPWYIEKWDPGVEVVFNANKNYFKGAPAYDKMIWKIIPSPANRIMLLENGELDVIEGVSPKDVDALSKKPGLRVMSFPSQNQFFMAMNLKTQPLDNKLVRQAVACAVPYDAIINSVYYGKARQSKSPVPVGTPGHDESGWKYDTDFEKAKALLKEAGYENGFEVELYIDNSKAEHEKAAILIQDSLSKVGVKVNIQKLNPAAFQEKKYTNTLPMYLDESLAWVDDPGYIFNLTWYTGAYSNNCNYSNKELDALVDEARFTLDDAKRNEMYKKAQEMLLEDCPAAFICQPNFNLVMKDDIQDFVSFFDELVRFSYMK